jgi:epoxyqueuosine reductase
MSSSPATRPTTTAREERRAVTTSAELADAIALAARELGFHRVGIAPVAPSQRRAAYEDWLARGRHGEMAYLATPEHRDARGDVGALLAGARSVVVVALAHARNDVVPLGGVRGSIARYARGEDYHLVLRDKLVALAERVAALAGRPIAARPCVDTAPLLERDAAERAGLGFVAKNTMLIAPGLGSYVMLGELVTDLELAPSAAAATSEGGGRCGGCRACLDACPTGAFVDAYVLDARRCISYLTIELEGAMPRELRPLVGTRVFGCDVCQEVCPYNAGPERAVDDALRPREPGRGAPDLLALIELGQNQYRKLVKRTALRRLDRAHLLRNVCVALGNAGDARAIAPLAARLASDPSALVRGHAAWALGRLGARDALVAARASEADPEVVAEIDAALAG